MASDREMHDTARDPAKVRSMARSILVYRSELTEFERTFSEDMLNWKGEALTYRQVEKLYEIRDDYEDVLKTWDGQSVAIIIKRCWMARQDISEEDQSFIERFEGQHSIKRKHVGRLLRCARELNIVEDYA